MGQRSEAWTSEPILHTFVTDCLPDDDPRAWQTITCIDCGSCLHAIPNECMSEWADTESGPMCLKCLLQEIEFHAS